MRRIATGLVVSLLALASCSTVETTGGGAGRIAQLPSDHFQLKVQTGDDRMDAAIYEVIYQQFSRVMPLRHAPPFTGSLEITFASTGQSSLQGVSAKAAKGRARSSRWYTGGRTAGATPAHATFLAWQDSTMDAVLTRGDAEPIWTANYSYKGGYEFSGFVIDTPEKAARLVARRLAMRFAADSKR